MSAGYVLRAPWYVRERQDIDLQDPQAERPAIQKYDTSRFADRILADPRDSLQFGDDDRWSIPVPIPLWKGTGRERFSTHRLVSTGMRKLYQPTHDRYYTVVVEVFCDQPGLPRAGVHDDLEVGFVMRRQHNTLEGNTRQIRTLTRNLVVDLTDEQHDVRPCGTPADREDLFWADHSWRRFFMEENEELIDGIVARTEVQSWMANKIGGVWRGVDAAPDRDDPADDPKTEEEFRMWRLPAVEGSCQAAGTRSLWFGVVPTYSDEHWIDDAEPDPSQRRKAKLDDHEIYQIVPFVRQNRPDPCAPLEWWGEPSEPFRLAAPFDPDGTKNHSVTITTPDLRRLAARAGQPLGPGGARIVTPPGSTLRPVDFGSIPGGKGRDPSGAAGSVCTFAFELFFLVALFLFQLFLPIIVFMFRLWWLLALRFCIPPAGSFRLLSDFFADGHTLNDLADPDFADEKEAVERLTGLHGGADLLRADPAFIANPGLLEDLVAAMDSADVVAESGPPLMEGKPDDPLCPDPL